MASGPARDPTCPPQRLREDLVPTPCAMFSTLSSTYSKVAVIGGFCPTTSLRGLPSTITSGNCALAERGVSFTGPYGALRGTEYAKPPMHRWQLWIPRALRPPRRVPDRTAMTLPRTSKGASGTFWWTPWGFRSRCTSPRPPYKIEAEHSVFWPG
jgi:hypothetical protein